MEDRLSHGQGYRLLQGFPAPKLMNVVGCNEPDYLKPDKDLIVGVIPHPYCDPKVKGCGFCTFPHQQYDSELASRVESMVVNEIHIKSQKLGIKGKKVPAIYFGGGTANLTNPNHFQEMVETLDDNFDIQDAELSLEGVPSYFLKQRGEILKRLSSAPVNKKRLSLGIQTFDKDWIKEMGRTHFGDIRTVQKVIDQARKYEMGVSGDFLINLPGQDLSDMAQDVQTAMDLDLDQICIYNLVLYPGVGSEWSKNPEMMAKVPGVDQIFDNWEKIRDILLENGYVQSTLTNFEKRPEFAYEKLSYWPQGVDGIGFGPSGISIVSDQKWGEGYKSINHESAKSYLALGNYKEFVGLYHSYNSKGIMLLNLSRNLSRGFADLAEFKDNPLEVFSSEFKVLSDFELVKWDNQSIRLTKKGMFNCDSVIALLAKSEYDSHRKRIESIRRPPKQENNNEPGGFFGDGDFSGGM